MLIIQTKTETVQQITNHKQRNMKVRTGNEGYFRKMNVQRSLDVGFNQ